MLSPASKLLALLVVLASVLAVGAPAKAAPPTLAQLAASKLGLSCSNVTTSDNVTYVKCSGKIASFDGIGLDTDISIPLNATRAAPTLVMLHGWSQDKTFWESDTTAGDGAGSWHWNNVWFASKGWVVVNYTARGFQQSCGVTDQDANCTPNGYTHIADRRFETLDSQTLLGKLVDAGIAAPKELASTGDSYGGGQTWLLATSLPWRSPNGTTLQLAAGVPMYGWTDLLDSLAPNGRATLAVDQPANHETPYGIPKESYVAGLWAVGRAEANGRYDENPADFGTNLDEQLQREQQGEPYDPSIDPGLQATVESFRYRDAFEATDYFAALQAGTVRPVPVLSVQGWTDPLFPVVQTLQMFRKLKAADPSYPIQMVFGDVGHSNAQNPAWQWQRINTLAYGFLAANVLGQKSLAPPKQAYSLQTECSGTAQPATIAGAWDSLASSNVELTSTTAATTSSADPNGADGADSDPIANSGCRTEEANTTDPGAAYYSFPSTGEHLLGLPTVHLPYTLTGQDATVAFKLWDQKPDGSKTLVTRGEYWLSTAAGDPATGVLKTYLYGNDWVFPVGDTIVLQITQNDAPYLRPDNEPSVIDWSGVTLDLPTHGS
ncbi:MAG: X-Pro dipeptidyl-peptidase domain protein [Acidimicrobiaceae bacterium]|nr:X-Pro dipeptidyl-peptidase domain protein [Acidimicrobiaceae bacterium]